MDPYSHHYARFDGFYSGWRLRWAATRVQAKIMNLSHNIGPVASLIAGILILLMPRLLNYIVAIYLIVIGLIGLFGSGSLRI